MDRSRFPFPDQIKDSSQPVAPYPHGQTIPVGIVSQTLAPSPTVRWILPARIRSRLHNDVVFVGENFVQLREFHYDGPLADVTARINLGSQILAAKVISADTEPIPFLEQVLDQQQETERYIIRGQAIDDSLPPQILVATVASGHIIFLYAKEFSVGDVRFVYGRRAFLPQAVTGRSFGRQVAVDPR